MISNSVSKSVYNFNVMLLPAAAARNCCLASSGMLLYRKSTDFSALLNNQTNGQNQTELSQHASDQHETKSSVMGSSRRVHLRLRERVRNGFGAASPNPVVLEIEVGQCPVEPNVQPTKVFNGKYVRECWSDANKTQFTKQLSSRRRHLRLR